MRMTAGKREFSLVGTAFFWALFMRLRAGCLSPQAVLCVTGDTCPQGAVQWRCSALACRLHGTHTLCTRGR